MKELKEKACCLKSSFEFLIFFSFFDHVDLTEPIVFWPKSTFWSELKVLYVFKTIIHTLHVAKESVYIYIEENWKWV